MELVISGLKCDKCLYRDDSVPFSDYYNSIDKPCPKCGANLLTEKQYDECIKMYKTVEIVNKVGNVLKWINPFHYWRLVFGDKRTEKSLLIKH